MVCTQLVDAFINIAMRYRPAEIVAVDIDESLIDKAKKQLRLAYSLQDPEGKELTLNVGMRFHYFPRSMTHMFGYVPMNVPPTFESSEFPYNVKFKSGDFMELEEEHERYDTVLA